MELSLIMYVSNYVRLLVGLLKVYIKKDFQSDTYTLLARPCNNRVIKRNILLLEFKFLAFRYPKKNLTFSSWPHIQL